MKNIIVARILSINKLLVLYLDFDLLYDNIINALNK